MELNKIDYKTIIVYVLASTVLFQLLGPYLSGLLSSLPQIGQMAFIGIGGALVYIAIESIYKKRQMGSIWKKDATVMLIIGIGVIIVALILPTLLPGAVVLIR